MNAVYIHIPFCQKICSYCDFCKVLYKKDWANKYLASLKQEIESRYQNEIIKTIYIGGGTPSALSTYELQKLLEICQIFKLSNEYEFTFECNINDISLELLEILKNNKVNRLSIGIESFDKRKLKFMERNTNFKDTLEKIQLIRSLGFNNINVDLIYGIPKETISTLKKDLKKILLLNPEHISTYSLIIEDNTKIGITNMVPIKEEIDYKMYQVICRKLKKKGYIHYEVSNFAKEGYSSNHNLNYWYNNEYYGFGLGASGYIGNIRYTNTKNLTKYLHNDYEGEKNLLSKKDEMDNEIMLNLRLLKGLNVKDFYKKYNVKITDVYNIVPLLENKELLYKDNYIYINPDYIYIMNEILIKIL